MSERSAKIYSTLIAMLVIAIIMMAGPANAFILGLIIPDPSVDLGDIINFDASLEIENDEFFDIQKFVLTISGPIETTCEFDTDGAVLLGCEDMTIEQTSSANEDFGYGYGFTNGIMSYNFNIDTSSYLPGTYETNLKVILSDGELEVQGSNLFIGLENLGLDRCSLRANKGEIEIDGILFSSPRTKLNFNVPSKNAADSTGHITAQSGRTRFSYDFEIVQVLENGEELASILVKGVSKFGSGPGSIENAVIYINKDDNDIDIVGDSFAVESMDITFQKNCL